MSKNRLEAFSDGVLAIIITIMVLEMKVPHGSGWENLTPLIPVFISYLLSFLYLGIYWGNHHHLLHTISHVNPSIMLANLNLLFWLSLIPFVTGWMGENHFESNTVALYAVILLLCGFAYFILQKVIENSLDDNSHIKNAMKKLFKKEMLSIAAYTAAIPMAYINYYVSGVIFFATALMWLIPDRNIEKAVKN
ncbi:MAG TPA: TMEM175 family protein [Ignavibacteria bacterium]|nr:TMEM175 family protein [Ignavibacteria bacterium]HMR40605.1 TMEM175 family protein [Ignavibacteria bacterium]